jgi:RNA polymerase sigma factor (sigma-70 family)
MSVARSFEDLYRVRYRRLTRLAHVMVGSNEVAEEIVQDAFVALYRRFGTVADPDGYLYRSVVNGAKGRYRRKRAVDRLTRLRQVTDQGIPDIDETRAALLKLSPRRRAAVALRYYDDLSVDTIAEILDCQPGTVRSLLHRALADLKELIDR